MQNLSSCLKKQQSPNSIQATRMEIKTIDILPTSKCNCTLLSLSFNHISDLSNIKQFSLLTTLYLESNCIERISELEPLSHLPQLKTLSLSGNKVCCLPLFKAHIINLCPQLQFLDGKDVSSFFNGKYSREKFKKFVIQEKKCFKSIYINDFIAQILKSKKKNHCLTQDCVLSFLKSQNYQNTIQDLRLRSRNLSPSSYFKFLKQTMIALYRIVFKTATLLELEKNSLSQYSQILQSFEQIDHFNIFLDKAEQLDKIAFGLLNITENYFDENTFNEFQQLNHISPSQRRKVVHRIKNKLSNSSDSISSQFCNSEEFHNKAQTKNKAELISSKSLIFIDDNDSASLSNDSNNQTIHNKKPLRNTKEKKSNIRSSDFEFSSDPLKTSSSKKISINNKLIKPFSKRKVNSELIHEEEPASEETLPKSQQSVSSELSNVNHNDDTNKSNLFLTELASEEIISKSQQSFSEVNSINIKSQMNKITKDTKIDSPKNTSTEIEADEITLEIEKKNNTNNNADLHIHFLINQSNSPELASDEITQNTQSNQSDSINQNNNIINNDTYSIHQIINSEESNKNIHFPTSQVELASDEANQDSEVHTDSAKVMQSLSIEAASSSSSNKDENFDQLSEGNENSSFKKNESKNSKAVQISTSLELASDETLPHSSIVHQQTSESDLQNANTNEYKHKNNINNDHLHQHHLKLPQSASLEFASDETLSNTQKSSSAFEDSESDDGLIKSKKNQLKDKINRNVHEENIISQDSTKKSDPLIEEEEEPASEEGQNEDHTVLFDKKVKKLRLDASKEKHLKASQESFSLDEMASGETLPSANPHSSDDSDYESENKKLFSFQFSSRNIQNNSKQEKINQVHAHNKMISEDSENIIDDNINNENDDADFEDNADVLDSSSENGSDFEKEKVAKRKMIKNKIVPPVSALSTYFKIWKMNYNFRIKRREMIKKRMITKYNLFGKVDQIKEMQKKHQVLDNIEEQKNINTSKFKLFKQFNYENQNRSQSSE